MTPASPWADRPRRVLVVDDDDRARGAISAALRDADYEVIEATSAVQAMRLLLSTQPDAVVLDLVLPDGHGIEIGRAMRAIVTTRRICVVAVTSSASSIATLEPASFGAETILVKPVAADALLGAVGKCFADGERHVTSFQPFDDPDLAPPTLA
jgi:DNA-binding response OmpR family regulator